MAQPENLGSFVKENKALLQEYLETRIELLRLQGIRSGSKATGYLVWMLISLFLLLLVGIFSGLVLGFWLSDLTGSYVKGFGITTLILVVLVVLLTLFRRSLFIDPAVRKVIASMQEKDDLDEEGESSR